jgi:hypothetical protein
VPEVFDVLGAMGTPVQIKLPGKRPRDERLYLVHLLSQVGATLPDYVLGRLERLHVIAPH